jgi:hypothetical protein
MNTTAEYKCEHCNKTFAKERTLLSHLCEPKRRWTDQHTPANRIGFNAWGQFMRQLQPTNKKTGDYSAFIKVAYYSAFVKFGNYCVESKVINPLGFSSWLVKHNIRIDDWCKDIHYTNYLIEYLRMEDPLDALYRGIQHLSDAGQAENIKLADTMQYLSVHRLCGDIVAGRISPWIIYNCKSGETLRNRFDEQNAIMVYPYIDPDVWTPKFMRDREKTAEVKELLKKAGL